MLLELVMIVKNSGFPLISVLETVKPFIDHWTILDTGSVDNTKENIKETLKGKPGNLYEEPFVDFSTSRNRVLDLAGDRCKYTLMLDDTYILNGGSELRKLLKKNKGSVYGMRIVDTLMSYYSARILKTSEKKRYIYRVHEVIEDDCQLIVSETIYIHDKVTPYMKLRTEKRWLTDIKFLKKDLADYPRNPRILYYLARTYLNMKDYKNAVKYCLERTKVKENFPELAITYNMLGRLYNDHFKKDWKEIEKIYLKAYEICPYRLDPLCNIANHYFIEKDYETSYKYMLKIADVDPKGDSYPSNPRLYKEIIPEMFVKVAYMRQEYEVAKNYSKIFIKKNPSNAQMFHNILHILEPPYVKLIPSDKKIIVFHAMNVKFNPQTVAKKLSGSEIMTINLAESFIKLGYRVLIFADLDRMIYKEVEYRNCVEYNDFLEHNPIYALIVSRNFRNLVYYENIERVFLWMHDVVPDFIESEAIQIHKTKFKGVLCLSEWHKKHFLKYFDALVLITRNGINPERFLKDVKKVPYKFIYSSAPDRGLDNLVDMFPRVKEKYPLAELYIYANKWIIESKILQKIEELDYIYLHERVDQDKIAEEYLSSDIWMYPLNWKETYCITALEAQMAGCLCICSNTASLSTVVGNRGILIKGDASTKEFQDEMLKKLFFVLDHPEIKERLIEKGKEWAEKQTIDSLAKEWETDFF